MDEKVLRLGWVDLNLTPNFGRASDWGVREGIRELIQNFADNVHGTPGGSERLVDWVLETTENNTVLTYFAYARGPTPRPEAGVHQWKNYLGYIVHRKKEGRFVLVNKNTVLLRNIWSMGETSRGGKEHHIGVHGEGMKVGIAALLRQNFKVTYYTNSEVWNWEFHQWQLDSSAPSRRELSIRLHAANPMLAKADFRIWGDVRQARMTADKDTTVIVQAPNGASFNIDFDDYLFLNPQIEGVMRTDFGDVLINDDYRGKIFVKGIFTQERSIDDPHPLRYGINLRKAKLDRDRKILMTESQITIALSRIWDTLIARSQRHAAKLYLELLLAAEPSLEILNSKESISRVSAIALFEELRSMFPCRFFYSLEDKEPGKTIRIIRDCLHHQPQPIPVRLHDVLVKYGLITTPQAERLKIFAKFPRVEPQLNDPWIRHTIYASKASLFLHPALKQSTFEFRDVPETVSIDILPDKRPESEGVLFHIHHRFLNFHSVHQNHPSCPLSERLENGEGLGFEAVCDCAVEDLMELILAEFDSLAISERRRIRSQQKRLLEKMPRHLFSESEEISPGNIQTKIEWEVFVSGHFGLQFEVSFFPHIYGNIAREGHYFHESSKDGDGQIAVPPSSESAVMSWRTNSGPILPSKSPGSSCSTNPLPDCLWQQKSQGGSCCFQWDSSNSPLVAGRRYVALVRSVAAKGSFFSEPFAFEILCPAPQNVKVKRDGCKISVTWEFPFDVEAQFRLICSSIYDQIYLSDFGNEQKCDFDINLEDVLRDLDIRVQAISSDKIKSTEVEVHSRANEGQGDSTSASSQCPEDETAESRSTRSDDCEHELTTSPSKQSSDDQSHDDSNSSIMSPITRIPSPRPMRQSISKPSCALTFIDVESDILNGSEGNDSDFSFHRNSDEGFGNLIGSVGGNRDRSPSLEIPVLHEDNSLQTADRLRDLGSLFEAGIFYQVVMQRDDHDLYHDDGQRVIHVRAIVRRTPETILAVSTYVFGRNLPFSGGGRAGDEELFLIYSDWMNAGQENDAEDLPISKIKDVVGRCHIQMPVEVPEGPDFSLSGPESYNKFVVQWGISAASLKMEIMADDGLRLRTLEIRNLNNPRNKVAIDSSDALSLHKPFIAYNLSCGMGGLSTGFTEAGFDVAVGVESDPVAAESWKKNQSGRIFTEDIATFVDKIPIRIQDGGIAKPTVLLISIPETGEVPHLSNSRHEDTAIPSLAKTATAIEILNPPLIVFESTPDKFHPAHIAHLYLMISKLLELGYELRMSVLKSTNFGVSHSQERLVLLASRLGLPVLPGADQPRLSLIEDNRSRASVESDELQLKLRAQGFKLPFQLCGNHEGKLALIERAFPPPMAKVIGVSLRMHIKTVMQMVVSVHQEPRMVDRQKRPPEEKLQSACGKRRCRSETDTVIQGRSSW